MKVINASYEIMSPINGMEVLKHIERIGRVCYKSEDKITDDSCIAFIKMLIKRGHEAMIEHYSLSVKFICDRGVSHEIVRHRVASFAQESTRYCNYGKADEITVIAPLWGITEPWSDACLQSEESYLQMLKDGHKPEQARSVLPNSLKTEIVMTANLREWRHFFKLRTASTAHPQMREITRPLLAELKTLIPVIFDDIEVE